MTLIRRSFKICFLWPDLARSPGSSLSECVRQTGPWGTSSYWWLEQLEKITKQWNINKDLLLKALVIAFKTRIYKNASIFVWRVYLSLRLETCQSLNLLTLVWGNKNNRQIKEAKCHRQKFKSFCSSQLLLSCRRFVNISPLLNSGKPQFSKDSICKQRCFLEAEAHIHIEPEAILTPSSL